MTEKLPQGISIAKAFGGAIDEDAVLRTADAMVSSGFVDAGYTCLMLGDGIFKKVRVGGRLAFDEYKFPRGIKYVTDELKSRGITAGILLSAGTDTESGAPGSLEYEFDDAVTVAEWGFSYVAYDMVNVPRKMDVLTLIRRMGVALRAADVNVTYAVYSDLPDLHVRARANGVSVYCRRTFAAAAGINPPSPETYGYSGDYCRQSLGNVVIDASTDKLTVRRDLITAASFTSPFFVECDPLALSDDILTELKNPALLSILHDSEARSARVMADGVWCKFLDRAEYAVAFVNDSDESVNIPFYAFDFGVTREAGYTFRATDVFSGKVITFGTKFDAELSPREAVLYRVKLV